MALAEFTKGGVPVKLWTPLDEVESSARAQLENVARLPWVFKHVAAMPDVHYGIGATVGSVIAMESAVAPAAVGVDIGCGMAAVRTNLDAGDLPDSMRAVRESLENAVPLGFHMHREAQPARLFDRNSEAGKLYLDLRREFRALSERAAKLKEKSEKQLGSLGGGNHFIELCLDTQGRLWILLHSGSRNIGKELAEFHISRARRLAHNLDLPDPDLAVFLSGSREMDEYRRDLYWCQRYAYLNRLTMLELIRGCLLSFFPGLQEEERIVCHHNYVAEEWHYGKKVFITRKGAIRAGAGEMGIIPGSMGAQSFIVRGLGNPESFSSASHGAGRRMSRNAAKKSFSTADLQEQTRGVECRKDGGVIDEIPAAYKDIGQVMANQKDLVEIVYELKQIVCVKG
ncbi:MAG: RtcB family protein [Spirochaetales bacterium]|nr:RtcB family protein [Spirochaetales bacterium]